MESVGSYPIHRETGPLRNGNQRGNPNAAPRCSAKTKKRQPCGSPAMRNGKCRMHGGASTGAKTPEGKAAALAASTRHGFEGEFGRLIGALRQTMVSRARQRAAAKGNGKGNGNNRHAPEPIFPCQPEARTDKARCKGPLP